MTLPASYAPIRFDGPPHPFIVLEGVSGIGKSTLARTLTERLRATSLHTLPTPHTNWSDMVNSRLRALPQFAFYLSGLLHASDSIRSARTIRPVVADRYASSVLACHAAVHNVPAAEVMQLLEPFVRYLERPTMTVYLTCSEAVLRKRMATKSDTKQDDHDLFAVPGRLARLLTNFAIVQDTDPSAVALQTDGKSPVDLANWITAHLEASHAQPRRHRCRHS